MAEKEQFDLSKFMADSLSIQVNANPSARMSRSSKFYDPYKEMLNEDPSEFLRLKSWKKFDNDPHEDMNTPIMQFYNGVNILITGGTGFFGKVLTEKLIRCVPGINQIYLLVRAKRGKHAEERFEELFQDKLFERMQAEVPHYSSKVTLVEGDLSQEGLGLSPLDRFTLSSRVQVVFHSAADVRFIEPLKSSITSNVLGSLRVLDLAKEMIHLKSFVHVSTAYSQCIMRRIPEAVPKLPISYKEILQLIESRSEEELEKNKYKIMMGWPSSYTFGKAVCEDMIQEESRGMPICIFRPAVVGATYKEPVRGWTDNLYGPTGLFVGGALGVLHSFRVHRELSLDYVPVDYVINAMIAASWKNQFTRYVDTIQVYNFSLPSGVKKNWKQMVEYGLSSRDKYPLEKAIYYTSWFVTHSDFEEELAFWVLHKFPGILIDKWLVYSGHKPRLTKVYTKVRNLREALSYFVTRTWEFENDNSINLRESLTLEDKEKFNFDMADLDLQEFFYLSKLGVRYFYLKEKMESIPKTEVKNKWLKWTHYSLKIITGVLLLKALVVVSRSLPI